ncbi:unnamed protein product [Bursaphelenchus xylophilus]|uniref:Skp1-related protein n=1 Tax=Bursaphelenchus xylophilus TaxID=6326 RepID=A0A1I7SAW8_BURXY|nr:unnamed protein product [Bursaphelenchus xylophilus]CAG9106138.1 unnamed protein product [Bursaphelenchus xylophilus]
MAPVTESAASCSAEFPPALFNAVANMRLADDSIYALNLKFACQSKVIYDMIKNLGINFEEINEPVEIPCANVTRDTMVLIEDWMAHHPDDDRLSTTENAKFDKNLSKSELRWFRLLNEDELYNVIMAANFFDMPHLLDKCCENVASMIRGRTSQEMAEILGFEDNMSKEKVDSIRRENVWLGD